MNWKIRICKQHPFSSNEMKNRNRKFEENFIFESQMSHNIEIHFTFQRWLIILQKNIPMWLNHSIYTQRQLDIYKPGTYGEPCRIAYCANLCYQNEGTQSQWASVQSQLLKEKRNTNFAIKWRMAIGWFTSLLLLFWWVRKWN